MQFALYFDKCIDIEVEKSLHGMKLLNHFQTSTVALLRFGNAKVISLTLYNWYNYSSMLGLKLNHLSKSRPLLQLSMINKFWSTNIMRHMIAPGDVLPYTGGRRITILIKIQWKRYHLHANHAVGNLHLLAGGLNWLIMNVSYSGGIY